MADPVLRPLRWPREFHVYAEQNGMFDVLMETFRELLMWKPSDPLSYIRDEIPRIAKSIYSPRIFILGPSPAAEIGKNIADSTQAVYLTLEDIINSAPAEIRPQVFPALYDYEPDQCLCNLLVAVINRRLSMTDCMKSGYVLHGFPRTKTESMYAQQNGLIPRQVFVLLPEPNKGQEIKEEPFGAKPITSKMSLSQMEDAKGYFKLKDVGKAYSSDISRVIPHDRWSTMKQSDLEAEFLGTIISRKPAGQPWIPRIVILGPPGSGKSVVAEYIAEKFGLLKIDWMETIRGFSQWTDDTAIEAKLYLENLTPLSEDAIVTMLNRKLTREDALKKGWILEGFPENFTQAKIMEDLAFSPNRIFLMNVSEAVSQKRMGARRRSIISRRANSIPVEDSNEKAVPDGGEETNMRINPHSEFAVQKRYELFTSNLDDIMTFYGTKIIYMDGNQHVNIVKEFAEASVIRPPTLNLK